MWSGKFNSIANIMFSLIVSFILFAFGDVDASNLTKVLPALPKRDPICIIPLPPLEPEMCCNKKNQLVKINCKNSFL